MKKRRIVRSALLAAVLCLGMAACASPGLSHGSAQSGSGSGAGAVPEDASPPASPRPSVPGDAAAGTEYLYDFEFSRRYDSRVSDSFSLTFPSGTLTMAEGDTLFLLSHDQLRGAPARENIYENDVPTPYKCRDYDFSGENGSLFIKTHLYEPDAVEYIQYVYTDIGGVKTDLGVGTGSTEQELLAAYGDSVFRLEADQTEAVYFSLEYGPVYDFDCAYVWQPFAPETNEVRDITFYIRDGTVAAVEMVEPFELRYVYR